MIIFRKMKIREKAEVVMKAADEKFASQFGFHVRDSSFANSVDYMHNPKDSSSLAVTRILFGLSMIFDIPEERGGALMEKRWGDPNICHFPLFPFLQAIPMPYMAIVYAGLWSGAIGIMLGYHYRASAATFTVCYWYLFLIEKSFWNNHSYLFGLIALLLTFTEANCYWSIDAYQDPSKLKTTVPYWNYFILKYQFFILYFMAGMKKGTAEWLSGYSVQNLSEHWVFSPFKIFLTVPQIDYFIVHWFIFVFDLTITMWMMYSRSRNVAMVFCALFHLMNSRLFRIGMFPWVCLATMPLFYPFDWPKVVLRKFEFYHIKMKHNIHTLINKVFIGNPCCELVAQEKKDEANFIKEDDVLDDEENSVTSKTNNENNVNENKITQINKFNNVKDKTLSLYFIIFHVLTQALLPYSHYITKGYNNWTNGLYGYSWDMMVHTWDIHTVIVKVVDNENQSEFYIDPYIHTPSERWTRHNDMVYQYARCLREKLIENGNAAEQTSKLSQNMSIYIDVWCSMNGRFTQRHFDPKADMLKVDWSPFKTSSFVLPLLDDALVWREYLHAVRENLHFVTKNGDVLFLADFPGYEQEKYVSIDLENVTLTVLEGEVVYEPEIRNENSYKLSVGGTIPVHIGNFHKVLNVGKNPAYYMYIFYNNTDTSELSRDLVAKPKLPVFTELYKRLIKMTVFVEILLANLRKIFSCTNKCE